MTLVTPAEKSYSFQTSGGVLVSISQLHAELRKDFLVLILVWFFCYF